MKNIRKLIPSGILPSRNKLKEMSKSVDVLLQSENNEDNKDEKVKHKVTEASWKKTVKMVNSAISR